MSRRLEAGDYESRLGARIEGADSDVLEDAEPNGPSLRVIRRQHGQFRAHREATEVLGLAADVDEPGRNQTARDDLGAPEGRLETRLQQRSLALDVQDVATELADVRVVDRVHVDASHAQVVPLNLRKGVCQ